MKEKKTVNSFKIITRFILCFLFYGILIGIVGIYIQNYLFDMLGDLNPITELGIVYILGIILDLIIIFLSTIGIKRKYQVKKNDKKIIILVLVLIMFIMCSLTTMQVHEAFVNDFKNIDSKVFFIALYPIILVPRLLMLIYPSKAINIEQVIEEPQIQTKTYKIESDEPIYKEVDIINNQVIGESIDSKIEEIWTDEVKKIEGKDILIVPEIKEKDIEQKLTPIGIKTGDGIKEEVKFVNNNGIFTFNGFDGVEPIQQNTKTCPNCGMKTNLEIQNCPNCGNQL